ncbi:hypothetical protein ACIP4W_04065 [Streptomyces sp. NPDC088846]|uniref:hypothetical protein n=1 Tax=Streptomyces sp. NPDC088846 TaxID=3365908 RepID=UPI00381E9F4C
MTVPGQFPSRPEGAVVPAPCPSSPEPPGPSSAGLPCDALQDLDLQDIELPGTAQALEQFYGDP